MSFVRHFTLINSLGQSYDLTNTQTLLTEPKGLGMKRQNTYRKLGSRFFLIRAEHAQTPFEGEIIFTPPDAYIKYNEFMSFLTHEPLILQYKPIDNYDYYRYRGRFPDHDFIYNKSVMIREVQKGDLTTYATLDVKIQLEPTTPWFRQVSASSKLDENDRGLTWEVTSDWPFTWEQHSGRVLALASDCQIPSPCRLLIPGPIVNPEWRHYANGSLVATGKVKCSVPDDHYLSIDNLGEASKMVIINRLGDEINDVYPDSDFSTKRFLEIQNGNNYITVNYDDASFYNIQLEAMLYYESI